MSQRPEDQLPELSGRELAVLALVAEGLTNRGVAERMCLSVRTVESHVSAILGKLCPYMDDRRHRRVLAVLAYLRSTQGGAPLCGQLTGSSSSASIGIEPWTVTPPPGIDTSSS